MTKRDRFVLRQGATFKRNYNFIGIDYTGATVKTQIRSAPGGTLFLEADNGMIGGIVLTITPASGDDPVSSLVAITVDPTSMSLPATLPVQAVMDLRVTQSGGEIDRVVEADVVVSPAVTT